MHKRLRFWCQLAAALGFLSVSLTGEMASAWLAASWGAWFLGFIMDRSPIFQARLRRVETMAVALMVGFLVLDFFVFRYTFFVSITHFLLLFQIVKLVGTKDRKDCFQIFLFSFLQILAACTLSVDAWHAAILLAMIPTATAVLFWNQMTHDCEEARATEDPILHRRLKRMALLTSLTALPLNVVLTAVVFVLFPRLTLNASVPGFGNPHAGYADQINLAQKGALEQNNALVLWINFSKPEDRLRWDGYLRGEVLGQFDGRQWNVSRDFRSRQILPDSNGVFFCGPQSASTILHQMITLADTSASTLFISGRALRVLAPLPSLLVSEGGSLRWTASWRRPLHYEVISGPLLDTDVLPSHLALPPMSFERVAKLAHQVAGSGPPKEQAQRIEQFLMKNYRYSTDFGDQIVQNPVDYFLFDRRQGACGHFASAMALMLRLQKIPSRLVAGYYKGEWNGPAQSIVMRERDAHAWVEAYIPGQGWTSFDPTPIAPGASTSKTNLLHTLMQYGDYLGLLWNRFVIQYDIYTQLRAFESLRGASGRVGQTTFSWWTKLQSQINRHRPQQAISADAHSEETKPFPYKRTTAFLILVSTSVFLVAQKHRTSVQEPLRFYVRFLDSMARAGHPKTPQETGWEFAHRLARSAPSFSDLAKTTTERYYQVRFSKDPL